MKFPFFQRFPFSDRPDTAVIVCRHVLAGKPILHVSHDADDGMWQFLCGQPHQTADARIISLKEACDLDPSIGALKDLPRGSLAQRDSADAAWERAEPPG